MKKSKRGAPSTRSWPLTPDFNRPHCYYIPADSYIEDHGYRVSVVFEDVSGHYPTGTWPYHGAPGESLPVFWGHDYEAAKRVADEQNARMGLSKERADAIVNSSMRAQNRKVPAGYGKPRTQ